jgi:anthranilate/para-aminobenzoate synthase component II
MILLIDHDDSFVHNLARSARELGHEAVVRRHDAVTLDEVAALAPSHVILSPGPCTPAEAGSSVALIRRFGAALPILGVCLGHQCIGAAYGGEIVRAPRPMHGKTSQFHPESAASGHGYALLERSLRGDDARAALPAGADALLSAVVASDDHCSEATASNLFALVDGTYHALVLGECGR